MRRDVTELAGRRHDVLVIGAGIAGAALARELALRGLAVALIDRDDFGAATSASSLRILHGGLRYLQSLDLTRTRASAREQAAWARIAPHLVRPLTCCVPTTRTGPLRRERLAAALKAYDALTARLRPPMLPRPRLCDLPELYAHGGGLEASVPLTGGAVWHELLCPRPERLILALVRDAAGLGAVVCNYAEATALHLRGGRVAGAVVRDCIADGSFVVRARVVVDATGPWAGRLLHPLGRPLLVAWNLVLGGPSPPGGAVGLPAGLIECGRLVRRLLFLVPAAEGPILGTFYSPTRLDAPPTPQPAHVAAAMRALRCATVRPAAGPLEPRAVQIGLLPADPRRPWQPAQRPAVVDHASATGPPGLYSLAVEKLTTARLAAERLARRIAARLGQTRASSGAQRPVFGGDLDDPDALARTLQGRADPDVGPHIARWVRSYGTAARELLEAGPDAAAPLAPDSAVTRIEVAHAVRSEMAVTLADVAFRRTELAAGPSLPARALEAASVVMAGLLGWSERRRRAEVALVRAQWQARRGRSGSPAPGLPIAY